MKVLIVSTNDVGGAANACFRLHNGLLNENVDAKVLVSKKLKDYPKTYLFKGNFFKTFLLKTISYLKYRIVLRNRSKELELFSFPESAFNFTKSALYKEASIINLHWVARFVDYSYFKKNAKPVVWTLHDMNPFTGGEHYNEVFLGIDEEGFPVKREITPEQKAMFEKVISHKRKIIAGIDNLTIVAPSEWLANEARNSAVFAGKPVYCIPYGLDSKVFSRRDKDYSRALFNIPKNSKVLLFVADSITNSRKGFIFLKKALEQLNDSNVILCAIGKTKTNIATENENIIELGSIQDEVMLSHVYSAADAFIIPSLMDNLPNTVLESLFCGTPVIGFPVGGIPEMVQDGVNGYLAETISVPALSATIKKFLDSDGFDEKQVRDNAVKKYDQTIQARKYIELFEKIINQK